MRALRVAGKVMVSAGLVAVLTIGLPTSVGTRHVQHGMPAESAERYLSDAGKRSTCSTELARLRVTTSQPDYEWDQVMRSYANTGQGWSGSDGGESVKLPDGWIVWLYDDTYVGTVTNDRRLFLHNTMVVENSGGFTTLYGDPSGQPAEFMNYGLPADYWYWSNDGVVEGDTLYVSYSAYHWRTYSEFGFVWTGTVLAGFSLNNFGLESVTPLKSERGILWGVWMIDFGRYTYIYGTAATGHGLFRQTYMYVAKVPSGHILSQWDYFDGSTWSSNVSRIEPVTNLASSQYSVTRIGNVYVLTTMKNAFESPELMMYFACSPTGPFTGGKLIYDTLGHGGIYGTTGFPGGYTYGAYAHPGLTSGNRMIISYDVNSSEWRIVTQNENIVRPRYLEVTISVSH